MLVIKSSKKKKNYYQIFYNDTFLGTVPKSFLPPEFFVDHKIECTEEYINSIKEWVYKNGLAKLLEYLSKMEKSVSECYQFLKRHDIPDSTITALLKDAQSRNWVSDARYSSLFVQEAILNGKSFLDIKHKLVQKKIDIKIIEKALNEQYTSQTKSDILRKQIDTLIQRYSNVDPDKLYEKVATALYRKGFQYSEYEDILHNVIDDTKFACTI